eukprot:m.58281 g.58281  ORF g.58281 m.58281 type:complete len:350 (-) comp11675_c0_seq4:68-1117(-)
MTSLVHKDALSTRHAKTMNRFRLVTHQLFTGPDASSLVYATNLGELFVTSTEALLDHASDMPLNALSIDIPERVVGLAALPQGEGFLTCMSQDIRVFNRANKQSAMHPIPRLDASCCSSDLTSSGSFLLGTVSGDLHFLDVETGRLTQQFYGAHAGRLNQIRSFGNGLLAVSVGDDGQAKVWDLRTSSGAPVGETPAPSTMSPGPTTKRSKVGSTSTLSPVWMRAVDVDSACNWMVTGGAAPLQLWNLRKLSAPVTVLKSPLTFQPNSIQFIDRQILVVGTNPSVLKYELDGSRTSIRCPSTTSLYSVVSSRGHTAVVNEMVSIGGDGNVLTLVYGPTFDSPSTTVSLS